MILACEEYFLEKMLRVRTSSQKRKSFKKKKKYPVYFSPPKVSSACKQIEIQAQEPCNVKKKKRRQHKKNLLDQTSGRSTSLIILF